MKLRHGSLFAGIGGFEAAGAALGWELAWASEIEPYSNAVHARRFPASCRRVGNVVLWDPDPAADAVDVVTAGWPCQDLSVAGRRAGLKGERSGLFWEIVRIAGILRPAWLVCENVPGLLSSHRGRDFGEVLTALDGLGYGVAWRCLDAQFFGVPQRRRRIFLVGRLGAPCPPEVLFEPEGVRGHPAPRGQARPRAAPGALARAVGRVGGGDDPGANKGTIVGAVNPKFRSASGGSAGDETPHIVLATLAPGAHPGGLTGREAENGMIVVDPISANEGRTYTHEGDNFRTHNVVVPVLEPGRRTGSGRGAKDGAGVGEQGDPMFTLEGHHQPHGVVDLGGHATAPTLKAEGFDGSPDAGGRGLPAVYAPEAFLEGADDAVGADGANPLEADRAGAGAGLGAGGNGMEGLPPVGCDAAGEARRRAAGGADRDPGQLVLFPPLPGALPAAADARGLLGRQDAAQPGAGPTDVAGPATHGVPGPDVVDARGARIVPGPAPALRDGGRAQGAGSSHDNTPVVIEPSATLRGFGHGWQGQHNDTNAILAPTVMADWARQAGASSHGPVPPHVIVVPLTTDAASGRSGDAVTPSPDAEGRVRLRPPSAGVGEPGDPAFTVQAHGAPAVFEARVARNGRGAPAPIVPPVKAESGDTGKGDSAPLVVGLAQITSWANRANPKPGDPAATLPNRGQLLAYDALNQAETGEVGHTIRAGTDHGHGHQSVPHVVEALAYRPGHPRRLTPTECERLQSFPDGWTCTCGADPYTTETCRCKDSPRYRSLGNAVAVVCVLWILARLDRVAEMEAAA